MIMLDYLWLTYNVYIIVSNIDLGVTSEAMVDSLFLQDYRYRGRVKRADFGKNWD